MRNKYSIADLRKLVKHSEYMPLVMEASVIEFLRSSESTNSFACTQVRDTESDSTFQAWFAVGKIIDSFLKTIEQEGLKAELLAAPTDAALLRHHGLVPKLSVVPKAPLKTTEE